MTFELLIRSGGAVALVTAIVGIHAASAAEHMAELLAVGAEPRRVEFVASDDKGRLTFLDDRGEKFELAADELVRWSTPAAPRLRDELHLVDGSRLCLAPSWSGKPSISFRDDRGTAKTSSLDSVHITRSDVRAVLFQLPTNFARRDLVLQQLIAEQDERDDVALLDNGDLLRGKLVGIGLSSESDDGDDKTAVITLEGNLGRTDLPIARVRGIVLAANAETQSPPAPSAAAKLIVGLRDGSSLNANGLSASDQQLAIVHDRLGQLRGRDRTEIDFLQSLGGRVKYLSDLEPSGYLHEPYLDLEWPYRLDRNVLGGLQTVDRRRFVKGVAMHSAARLSYALDGSYRRFAASVALDDAAEGRGSVVFRVFLRQTKAARGAWQAAYASPVVRGGDPPRHIAVELKDASELALVVDYAERGDERDYANWLDARLEK